MSTTTTSAIVVDDGGVRIGNVDEQGQVRDFAGVHIGSVRADEPEVAVDFSRIRLGRVERAA